MDDIRNPIIPTVLSSKMDEVAPGWTGWEPEAVEDAFQDLPHDIKSVDNSLLLDMCLAIQTLKVRPDLYCDSWEVFEKISHALNCNEPNFGHLQPLSPAEVVFSLHIAKKLLDKNDLVLGHEVESYIEAVLASNYLSVGILDISHIKDRSTKKYRQGAVTARYDEIKDESEPEFKEDEVDIEAAKLWAINKYMHIQIGD